MLCLTRREGQSVIVDTPAGIMRIRTNQIRHGIMRLNIDAPIEFQVVREEAVKRTSKRRFVKRKQKGDE